MSPEEQKDGKFEFVNLPAVSDLETEVRQRVVALLEALDHQTAEAAKLTETIDANKDELQRLQKETGKTGFRYGLLCYVAQPVKGRKTLDKMLLMENGVSARIINSSYKEGAPGTRQIFKRLPEE